MFIETNDLLMTCLILRVKNYNSFGIIINTNVTLEFKKKRITGWSVTLFEHKRTQAAFQEKLKIKSRSLDTNASKFQEE